MKKLSLFVMLSVIFALAQSQDEQSQEKISNGERPQDERSQDIPSHDVQSQDERSRIDKGRAYVGLSFGVNFKEANNQNFLGLVNIVEEKSSGGNVQLNGGYFLGKYFSVGGIYQYGENNGDLLTEDADQIRTHTESIRRLHTIGAYVKYFTPLNEKERINLFARVGISYQDERVLDEATTNEVLTRTFQKTNTLYFGIIPGVQVLVVEGFAVEADISIAGLQSSWTDTWVNGELAGDVHTTSVSFDINLLTLNIGFFYYF
jgi:hypothetical protein